MDVCPYYKYFNLHFIILLKWSAAFYWNELILVVLSLLVFFRFL